MEEVEDQLTEEKSPRPQASLDEIKHSLAVGELEDCGMVMRALLLWSSLLTASLALAAAGIALNNLISSDVKKIFKLYDDDKKEVIQVLFGTAAIAGVLTALLQTAAWPASMHVRRRLLLDYAAGSTSLFLIWLPLSVIFGMSAQAAERSAVERNFSTSLAALNWSEIEMWNWKGRDEEQRSIVEYRQLLRCCWYKDIELKRDLKSPWFTGLITAEKERESLEELVLPPGCCNRADDNDCKVTKEHEQLYVPIWTRGCNGALGAAVWRQLRALFLVSLVVLLLKVVDVALSAALIGKLPYPRLSEQRYPPDAQPTFCARLTARVLGRLPAPRQPKKTQGPVSSPEILSDEQPPAAQTTSVEPNLLSPAEEDERQQQPSSPNLVTLAEQDEQEQQPSPNPNLVTLVEQDEQQQQPTRIC